MRDFGAKGDGTTLDTAAIQAAIRAANQAGGGTVTFLPGTYISGTFELLSNVTLDVESGAVIQGSAKVADYAFVEDFGFVRKHGFGLDYTGGETRIGLIVARNAENVGIVGQGVIDGNSDVFFDFTKPYFSPDFDLKSTRQGNKYMDSVLRTGENPMIPGLDGRPGTMIVFRDCKNLLIRDITLRNAPNWTLHLQRVTGATVDGIHIHNNMHVPNDDGVDCIGCRNVHFSNCDISAGDDDFAILDSEDISVTNSTLTTKSSAIRLENTSSSVFSNLIIHANRGIAIYERGKGKTDQVLFSGITIDTQLGPANLWGQAEPIYIAVGETEGVAGKVSRVRFSNIDAEAENGIILYGDEKNLMDGVSLDQVRLRLRVVRSDVNAAVGGNFDLRWTTSLRKNRVFAHDIPGLYAHSVKELEIHGLEVEWADAMPAYYSSGVQIEDAEDVTIDDFQGRQASIESNEPVIALNRVKGVSIRNSAAAEGASTFLSVTQVTGERLFEGNDLARARRAFNTKTGFVMSGNLLPAK